MTRLQTTQRQTGFTTTYAGSCADACFRQKPLAAAIASALLALAANQALADNCTFNPASGNWNVVANWSCSSIPGAGDTATVGASFAVTVPGGFGAGAGTLNNAGTVNLSNSSSLTLRGSNQNTGSITLGSAGSNADLRVSGGVSLNGTGVVGTTNYLGNRILADTGAGDVLTLGAGQSVIGAAQIGAGGALGLVNNGALIANRSAGMTLSTSGSVTNNNIIRGDNAVFTISGTTVNQGAAGVLDAVNGGSVALTGGSKIIGGTFTSDSGSAVNVASGNNARLSGVTNNGNLTVVNSASLYLDGALTNNGNLNLNSVGSNTDLITNGNQLIDGSGTITLSDRSTNRIQAANSGDRLTLGAGQTLQGSGQIGAGSGLIFDNTGTVIATQSAPLLINATSVNNTGTLRADGGTLQLQTTINSAGGQIEARNGSRVELLSGAIINNAAFSATGAGSLITTVDGATVTLGGGTVNGPMNVANNSALRLSGDLTYNGALVLNSVGNNTNLQIDGARTLGGNLTIGTSNRTTNRILALNTSGDVLTLGGDVTMQGAGQIGANTSLGLVNNGSLIANQSAGMTLSTTGSVTNNNVIRGDNAAFTISGTTVNQGTGGVLDAVNGGSVTLTNGSKIIGGTFTSDSGSAVSVASGSNARLSGVTNNGNLTVVNSASLYLDGTLTNNGNLNLSSVGNNTDLITNGNQLIDGSGTITLSDRSTNRIQAANSGDRLTLGAGQTLQGSGQIGAGSGLDLVNLGTITANQSNALTISVNAANSVRNEAGGLMQAVGGRTLNLNNVVQNDGTIAANGGNVNASAGFNGNGTAQTTGTGVLTVGAHSTVGTLVNDGSNANALTLGTRNITVSGDYTNANAGSGNSFNRRANVNGAGQILAGGDVAQVITGTGVMGGSTANATLTIGNVRVGANTFDYQIGNTGTTGPTLRGAIQTSVNGGNLTDARLSGAGVTAANYNAGGPGANSGNLGVTFTAANAGALTPLSGQVLNLRSNFDNIADQKLNIVLASGAAAYNAAIGSTSPSPTVNLGNTRVGGTLAQTFTVTNTAPTGAYTEDLNAGFVASSGAASHNNGIISGLLAGASNNSAMSASLNTASAGAKNGSVTIGYQTAGTVNSVGNGLAVASAGSETITLNGAVYNMAAGSATPTSVNIANQRVGGSNTAALTVSNTATAGNYSEDLRATFDSNSGSATNNGGAISALLAGGSDSSAMHVGVDTSSAGAKSGSVTLNYETTGTVNVVSNGLAVAGVGNQVINVSGNVYRLAQGDTSPLSINLVFCLINMFIYNAV